MKKIICIIICLTLFVSCCKIENGNDKIQGDPISNSAYDNCLDNEYKASTIYHSSGKFKPIVYPGPRVVPFIH